MKIEFYGTANEFFDEDELRDIEEDVKKQENLIKELAEHIENSKFRQYLFAEIKLEQIPLQFHKYGDLFIRITGKDTIFLVIGIVDETGDDYSEYTIGGIWV